MINTVVGSSIKFSTIDEKNFQSIAQRKNMPFTSKRQINHIPDDVFKKGTAGINAKLKSLNLSLSDEPVDPIGSKHISDNSKKTYHKHFNTMRYFFNFIGDYESLLMLLPRPPTNPCPSMNADSIAKLLLWKRSAKGTPLEYRGSPVMDVNNNQMICTGDWKDPNNTLQFMSAIHCIHDTHDQRGQYFEPCSSCIRLDTEGNTSGYYIGCRNHRSTPRLFRCGNPKQSNIVEGAISKSSKDGKGYVATGDTALMPWELLQIRTSLLSTNKLVDLQLWVMIIMSCKLALREFELDRIKIADFKMDLCAIDETNLFPEALSITIFDGKSDSNPVTLNLWRDDDTPLLCPVRILLVYLYVAQIQNGYIFPDSEQFGQPNPTSHISYTTYSSRFQAVVKKIVKRDGPFGTHCGRKTYYLLAVWGNGSPDAIMAGARHKTEKNAAIYRRDASFLMHQAEKKNWFATHPVSKFIPIYCDNEQMSRSILSRNGVNEHTIFFLAKTFVERSLKTSLSNMNFSIMQVCNLANEFKSGPSDIATFKKYFVKFGDEREEAERVFNRIIMNFASNMVSPPVLNHNSTSSSSITPDMISLPPPPILNHNSTSSSSVTPNMISLPPPPSLQNNIETSQKTKRKRGGNNDMDDRHQIRFKSTTFEKIELLKLLKSQNHVTSELTVGARDFYVRPLTSILGCLQNHFNNDVNAFVVKWGNNISHSNFHNKKCKGALGSSCAS